MHGVVIVEFAAISRYISETVQSSAKVTMECDKWSIEWCHLQWPWSTANPGFQGHSTFQRQV